MFGATPAAALQKRCPSCNRYYDDYSLKFCLDDGHRLASPGPEPATAILGDAELAPAVAPARAFISYKRNGTPDEQVAREVSRALGLQHDIFIDEKITVGTRWAECIETEIRRSDYLIVFLSAQSIVSEMVWGEIKIAHDVAKTQQGRPVILPIRVNFTASFPYPLNSILDQIQWLDWTKPEDTPVIIEKLNTVLAGGKLPVKPQPVVDIAISPEKAVPAPLPQAQPLSLEMPEGTMDPQSGFYVVRQSDTTALDAIRRQGVTMTIKGPRQMGKSSLLMRTLDAAREADKRILFLDFQQLDSEVMSNAGLFFREFCSWISEELNIANQVEDYWSRSAVNVRCCTKYVGEYLLADLNSPLVLAIDEVDSIFSAPFRSEFFAMLRSWHNNRAASGALSRARTVWKRLDLVLVTSTEPYQLIENLNQSPFNVGLKIEMEDFDESQAASLNQRHGSPFSSTQLADLMRLLNGQPYLLRRALYLVAGGHMTVSELFATATDDRGPFGDHLRYHVLRMHHKKELIRGLLEVIRRNKCPDEQLFFRLQGAGLVRRGPQKGSVVPRCQLYADYFREHLYE